MPRTICSDFSHFNLSISNSQDCANVGMKRKKKRIDKKKQRMPHPMRNPPPSKRRNIILNRALCKKLVYSPEYTININEVSTPLYHSDEYQPSFEITELKPEEYTQIKSYVDMEVLMKMYKEQHEEKEEKKLVQQMRAFQISSKEEDIVIQ